MLHSCAEVPPSALPFLSALAQRALLPPKVAKGKDRARSASPPPEDTVAGKAAGSPVKPAAEAKKDQ